MLCEYIRNCASNNTTSSLYPLIFRFVVPKPIIFPCSPLHSTPPHSTPLNSTPSSFPVHDHIHASSRVKTKKNWRFSPWPCAAAWSKMPLLQPCRPTLRWSPYQSDDSTWQILPSPLRKAPDVGTVNTMCDLVMVSSPAIARQEQTKKRGCVHCIRTQHGARNIKRRGVAHDKMLKTVFHLVHNSM